MCFVSACFSHWDKLRKRGENSIMFMCLWEGIRVCVCVRKSSRPDYRLSSLPLRQDPVLLVKEQTKLPVPLCPAPFSGTEADTQELTCCCQGLSKQQEPNHIQSETWAQRLLGGAAAGRWTHERVCDKKKKSQVQARLGKRKQRENKGKCTRE